MTVKIKDVTDGFIKEIEALKVERDALAAQVESLRKVANDAIHFASIRKGKVCADPMFVMQQLQNRIDATPLQCLRDVQAEAGRLGFLEGVRQMCDNEIGWFGHDAESCAKHYAARVRQGGAE